MTTAFKVEVFLNRQEDDEGRLAIFSRFRDEAPYQEGDALELVLTTTVSVYSKEEVLNKTWALTNRGSPTFIGDEAYPQRSLSVGDVVALDGERYRGEERGLQGARLSRVRRRSLLHALPGEPGLLLAGAGARGQPPNSGRALTPSG